MTTYDLIKQAIQNKRCVTGTFNGYSRKMTPHVIGTKNGVRQVLFYQYAGGSKTGLSGDPTQNWRCMPIEDLKNVVINQDKFQSAHNHSKSQTCVDAIDVEVSY